MYLLQIGFDKIEAAFEALFLLHSIGGRPQDVRAFRALVPLGGHFFDSLWQLSREIVHFSPINWQIVKRPRLSGKRHDFPIARSQPKDEYRRKQLAKQPAVTRTAQRSITDSFC
jgi:hypothetical protein